MLPRIEAKLLNNNFYEVKGVNTQTCSILFIDFQNSISQQPINLNSLSSTQNQNWQTISPNIYNKTFNLKQLFIQVDPFMDFTNIRDVYLVYQQIKHEIDKEFFKLATDLGNQHRDLDLKFDLTDRQLDKSTNKYRLIMSRLINAASYIATQGRFGPGQWITSNGKIYNSFLNHMKDETLTYKDNNLMIGNMPFIVNDLIESDIILMGRKNKIDQSGASCFILTDENDNIIISEILNPMSHKRTFIVQYAVESIGNQPYLQYLRINTKDISYYRYKKLQKIKDLYEL